MIDSRDRYRLIFHHLAACLRKRPELSRLTELTENSGTSLMEKDEWSRNVVSFLLGRMTDESLFEAAKKTGSLADEAEAFYYVAETKRLAGNLDAERALLTRGVTLQQFRLTEHWLAVARLREIGR